MQQSCVGHFANPVLGAERLHGQIGVEEQDVLAGARGTRLEVDEAQLFEHLHVLSPCEHVAFAGISGLEGERSFTFDVEHAFVAYPAPQHQICVLTKVLGKIKFIELCLKIRVKKALDEVRIQEENERGNSPLVGDNMHL